MPKVIFVTSDAKTYVVEASNGTTLMRAAVDNGVPGLHGDCGGNCACATCHVYIAPEWQTRLPKPLGGEIEMLQCALEPNEFSRLACQIELDAALDGLTVNLPHEQI